MTKKQTTIDSVPELPDWLNARTWQAFRVHRKTIKRPMTDYAEELILKRLARLLGEGHDPNCLLDASIEHGWETVYPERMPRAVATRQQTIRATDIAARDQRYRQMTGAADHIREIIDMEEGSNVRRIRG
jgi:hypothetical protein